MTDINTVSLLAELFTTPSLRTAVTPRLRGVTSSELFELEKIASDLLDQPSLNDFKQTEALIYLISNLFDVLDIPLSYMNQEFTSILAGTIDANNFSLAKRLGITNSQVRDWDLAGGKSFIKQQVIRGMINYFR